jgi:hypothetical protein
LILLLLVSLLLLRIHGLLIQSVGLVSGTDGLSLHRLSLGWLALHWDALRESIHAGVLVSLGGRLVHLLIIVILLLSSSVLILVLILILILCASSAEAGDEARAWRSHILIEKSLELSVGKESNDYCSNQEYAHHYAHSHGKRVQCSCVIIVIK